ncbi:quinol:cytochrome C oxidoreductase [Melioribacter sp. Ez-97]|uniref:quinol:cytochrome C oxidoreductase n=1 Tax=Melioribacter sp. Ez-97 TaxID=3423434 RepID=UPI003ED9AD85
MDIVYQKKNIPAKVTNAGYILLIAGIILSAAGYMTDLERSAFNNIILLTFIISVGVGALFLIGAEYLSGAVWSVPFRRIVEFIAASVLVVPFVALPVLANMGHIFHWMHPEVVEMDELLKSKAPYLNVEFFIIRVAAFIAVWWLFYFLLTRNSRKQDATKDQQLTKTNTKISAAFMPFFAITVTFTAIDWLMSLEPHWFSTIFGVYYFSGTVLAGLATATIAIILLSENGYLVKGISSDNYYSLGALLFAFTNFWAYIAFSQYLLIWYANLPEETFWFLERWEGSWKFVSIGLIFIRFVIPYFGLLSQPSKKDPKRLVVMSFIILIAHYYDLYWMVMPTFAKEGFVFGWIEIGFILLAAGILITVFGYMANKHNMVAIGDPKLKRGIDFRL